MTWQTERHIVFHSSGNETGGVFLWLLDREY
nr:MAG TPA: hypothetical protein [Caudoviricetes sp.]